MRWINKLISFMLEPFVALIIVVLMLGAGIIFEAFTKEERLNKKYENCLRQGISKDACWISVYGKDD